MACFNNLFIHTNIVHSFYICINVCVYVHIMHIYKHIITMRERVQFSTTTIIIRIIRTNKHMTAKYYGELFLNGYFNKKI